MLAGGAAQRSRTTNAYGSRGWDLSSCEAARNRPHWPAELSLQTRSRGPLVAQHRLDYWLNHAERRSQSVSAPLSCFERDRRTCAGQNDRLRAVSGGKAKPRARRNNSCSRQGDAG
jgi:hypothetical protein